MTLRRSGTQTGSFPRLYRGRPVWLVLGFAVLLNADAATQRLVAWGDIAYDLPANGFAGSATAKIAQISAGSFHSATLLSTGRIEAWGDNRYNQTNVPALFQSKPALALAAGNVHNLALLGSGTVIAWGPVPGSSADYGQCNVPAGLQEVVQIAAGAVHSLALRADGTVVAWGANLNGQCSVPAGLNSVTAIAGGMYHSVALRSDGTVLAWGDNARGQSTVPADLADVVAIAAGGFHTLALTSQGKVVSWGTYGLARCDVPPDLSDVVAIATGDFHSMALKRDRTLVTWGFNTAGQCTIPAGLSNISAIAARGKHSMVLTQDSVAEELPSLRLALVDGAVQLSWPVTASEFLLQHNKSLDPAKWSSVPELPTTNGSTCTVSLPIAGMGFFRLNPK